MFGKDLNILLKKRLDFGYNFFIPEDKSGDFMRGVAGDCHSV
jgi:hypothetical protein